MSQFIISSKESRIENNRSFYGCFYLGPFEPSQSITIANTLRRTLLSEIYGLAIVSVTIEGASHEYSSLPGVHESVLDILLNIKEIVLKKTNKFFTPQIGYLKVQGPGVVTASHLRLPPFIQSVDPDQYIATLSHNGCLNIKFIIQYGNKWLAAGRNPEQPNQTFSEMSMDDYSQYPKAIDNKLEKQNSSQLSLFPKSTDKQVFNFYFKKRRLFLKKLRDFGVSGSNSYIKLFSKSLTRVFRYKKKRDIVLKTKNKESLNLILRLSNKYPGINLKTGTRFISVGQSYLAKANKLLDHQKLINKTGLLKPKTKINNDLQTRNTSFYSGLPTRKLWANNLQEKSMPFGSKEHRKKKVFFNVNSLNVDAIFNPITKVNYIIEINDFKIAQNKLQTSYETTELYETLLNLGSNTSEAMSMPEGHRLQRASAKNKGNSLRASSISFEQKVNSMVLEGRIEQDLLNLLNLNQELSALTKETIKHNIILEIWTNGSLHPRDALNQALKNLIKIFIQLKNVQPFGIWENSLTTRDYPSKREITEGTAPNNKEAAKQQILLKKLKMSELKSQFLENLVPINETNYLSTYVSPKVRSYYFNKTNLLHILKNSIGNNTVAPIFIAGRLTPDI
jgi:DNA-directed RNA polymerase alpha subunit